MARLIGIFLLAIYVTVLIRPVMPFVEYALNRAYIAKNLCENRFTPSKHCNGKCHLAKQLQKANDANPAQPQPVPASGLEISEAYLLGEPAQLSAPFVQVAANEFFYRNHYRHTPAAFVFRPPCA